MDGLKLDDQRPRFRIGLVSDTHMPMRCREFPPALFEVMADVDLLLHAGDVGELWVLDQLSAIAPVVAVHGNDDSVDAKRELPFQQVVVANGRRILLWHGHFPNWEDEAAARRGDDLLPKLARHTQQAKRSGASMVVFGHWHIPLVCQNEGVKVVNPGALASGNEITRQLRQTAAILEVCSNGDMAITHFDLASPGEIHVPRIDWEGGFMAAWNQYSASILGRDVAEEIPYLKAHLQPTEVDELRDLVLRLAHRVWQGEEELITLPMLLDALKEDEQIRPQTREQVRALMAKRQGR
ncbi:MAG: metallophosphoesterase family protein [Caldilineaceae bacterium]|nr:metallophosphoesterase family protein [Caldilineaceae bacterium]